MSPGPRVNDPREPIAERRHRLGLRLSSVAQQLAVLAAVPLAPFLAVIAYSFYGDLTALTRNPAGQSLAPALERLLVDMVLLGAVLAVTLWLAVTISRSIRYPLLRLRAGTARLARGELGFRVAAGGLRELAALAEDFNHMAERITEANARLKSSRESFRSLFERGPLPCALSSVRSGGFLAVNDSWLALFGHAREQTLGRAASELSLWADPGQNEGLSRLLRERPTVRNFEARLRRADGGVLDTLLSVEIMALEGEPVWLWMVTDITARKRYELAVSRLNRELENRVARRTAELSQANRELEAFSYTIAHDLRAPLRAIDGYSRLLARDCGSQADLQEGAAHGTDRGRRHLERIHVNVMHMAEMIEHLLAFAHVGRGAMKHSRVDLQRIMGELAQECQPEGARVDIRVGSLPEVSGDASLLRQVFQNLLANAVKFSSRADSPLVEVSGWEEDGWVVCQVRDNGVGFDMDYAGKLFGVFQRLHRADEFQGTGVGLAIVHRIVTRHGGAVRAHGEPGRGATFTVKLPAESPPECEDCPNPAMDAAHA
ncbi:MAG: PAS domain S-box protein [Burkholderiales bacterium]|nr:PAS domain S-box protein [Burkholderiales bacterium]